VGATQEATRKLIATDGVFSMDGDLAPLAKIAGVAQRHDAWLMVDDAHGFGVLGAHGGGCCEYFGLDADAVPILVGTLGKAFGTFGAFIAGDEELIEYLIQQARTYIYTTALPPAVAEATRASLHIVQEEGWRREALHARIAQFQAGIAQLGIKSLDSQTPIQALILGEAQAAVAASDALRARGILVAAIRPPTVPAGSARLRITFSAQHTAQHVERLLGALAALPHKFPESA
jgi:8-amino-7-oxononanoate synthase